MTAFGPITPVFRIFDVSKAKEFYIDFLGFNVVFEHRFGDNFPLYMGLSLAECALGPLGTSWRWVSRRNHTGAN